MKINYTFPGRTSVTRGGGFSVEETAELSHNLSRGRCPSKPGAGTTTEMCPLHALIQVE